MKQSRIVLIDKAFQKLDRTRDGKVLHQSSLIIFPLK